MHRKTTNDQNRKKKYLKLETKDFINNTTQTNNIYKTMKNLKFILMLAIAALTFTACGSDDNPEQQDQNAVAGTYEGSTETSFQYMETPMTLEGEKIVILPTGENLVRVELTSSRFGVAVFENVHITKGNGYYIGAETVGSITMAEHGREPKTYDAILDELRINPDKKALVATIFIPGVMGGTEINFFTYAGRE